MKPYKLSIKLTSHDLSDDININAAINNLLSFPSMVRVCIQRLKKDWLFPIEYRLTVWYILRGDWTPEMIYAQTFWGPRTGIEIEPAKKLRGKQEGEW